MTKTNALFKSEPFEFAQQYLIDTLNMNISSAPKFKELERRNILGQLNVFRKSYFDLEAKSNQKNHFFLRAVFPGTKAVPKNLSIEELLEAYWVPYISAGEQGQDLKNVPYVDLPKNNPQYNLMFTGGMQGCSLVIVAPKDNKQVIRVYHDSAHSPETFKNETVILRLDYDNQISNSNYFYTPTNIEQRIFYTASNFLYYKSNQWHLVCQPQIGTPILDRSGGFKINFIPDKPPFEVTIQDISNQLSQSKSNLFPHQKTGLNYALNDEPILLNGMKVIFDESVAVYPVHLQEKTNH